MSQKLIQVSKRSPKCQQKMPEGTKLIASSPHSIWNISDNDSEQKYLAMSRQMKRQSSTDEPKAFLGGFFVPEHHHLVKK
jgi:hypothetical protein